MINGFRKKKFNYKKCGIIFFPEIQKEFEALHLRGVSFQGLDLSKKIFVSVGLNKIKKLIK